MIRDHSHHDVKESIIPRGKDSSAPLMIRVISARSLFLILVIPKKRTIIEDGKPADDREVGEEKKSVSWQQL